MAIDAAKWTPYPLTWGNQDQRFQTTIEQVRCGKLSKHPGLNLDEGVLCIAKNRRYRIVSIDPKMFVGFKSIKIDGVSLAATLSDGAIEFKIPLGLNISRNGKIPLAYGMKHFEISIKETTLSSDPFLLICKPLSQFLSKRNPASQRKEQIIMQRAIKTGRKPNPNFKGIFKFHRYDERKHSAIPHQLEAVNRNLQDDALLKIVDKHSSVRTAIPHQLETVNRNLQDDALLQLIDNFFSPHIETGCGGAINPA